MLTQVVSEKRRLYTQLSKASLLKEEQEAFHEQRVVAEELRVDQQDVQHRRRGVTHQQHFHQQCVNPPVVTASDMHHGSHFVAPQYYRYHDDDAAATTHASMMQQRADADFPKTGRYSGTAFVSTTASPHVVDSSSFLKSNIKGDSLPSSSTEYRSSSRELSTGVTFQGDEKGNDRYVTSHAAGLQPSGIQMELTNLDKEIEMLKEQLSREASMQSQKILNEVLEQSLAQAKSNIQL